MMKHFQVLSLIIIFFGSSLRAIDQVILDELRRLRESQKNASVHEYYEYEAQIEALKKEHGNSSPSTELSTRWKKLYGYLRDIVHSLPFIVWQLLLITVLLYALVRWIGSLILAGIILILGIIVGVGYYERTTSQCILSQDFDVYLGPGTHYAKKELVLHPLDEVYVLEQKGQWTAVEYKGERGWIEHADC